MAKAEYRKDVLDKVRAMLAGQDDVTPGQMMGHPVFYYAPAGAKRKMFACVYGPGLALKLKPELVETMLDEPGCAPFTPLERLMKGWLVVYRDNVEELDELEELLHEALAHAAGG